MNVSFKNLTTNTKLSETQFYTVKSIDTKNEVVDVLNDFGQTITLPKNYVENLLVSSDQVTETKKMSQTEIINLFMASTNVICTVNFNKKIDEKEVLKTLHALYPNKGGKILSESDYQKKVNEALKEALLGKERTMVGRHYGSQDEFGRIKFIDMEADRGKNPDYDGRQRLVDPRTVNWLIVKGIKYQVK